MFPAQLMMESANIGTAVELLADTPYYGILSHAMQRYSNEQSLFPLEVALDLDYWRKLWDYVSHSRARTAPVPCKLWGRWWI